MSADSTSLSLALLRVSPLAVSSASLMFAWAQHMVFGAFVTPKLAADPAHPSGRILPAFLPAFSRPGVLAIFLTYPTSTALAAANGLGAAGASLSPLCRRLYLAGALMSLAHFYYGRQSMRLVAEISDPRDAGARNEDAVRRWLPHNTWRTLVINIPAYICVAVATVGAVAEGWSR